MSVTDLLLPHDVEALSEYAVTITLEGDMVCLVLEGFELPAGLVPADSDLLLRLPRGFPDARPDMFWFADRVVRADGTTIAATDHVETYLARSWFRWSRHVGNAWRPGIDDLRSYLAYVNRCLAEAGA